MCSRGLTLICALAVVLGGYQPSLGMMQAALVEIEMSSSDCPGRIPDDCCDKTGSDKRPCVWGDACAARCHVSAGLEVVSSVPACDMCASVAIALPEPRRLQAARAGPHFRPPILSIPR